MPIAPEELRQMKCDMRSTMLARRAEAHAKNANASFELRDLFLKSIKLPPQSTVASTSAYGTEILMAPLADALANHGHSIALPVVANKELPLTFRKYSFGEPWVEGALGIMEPTAMSPLVEPNVVLVPLLAFDKGLHRLGYGAGYYDRTLTALREKGPVLAIGIAFACQEVPEIPTGPHDARLNKIVTEIKIFE